MPKMTKEQARLHEDATRLVRGEPAPMFERAVQEAQHADECPPTAAEWVLDHYDPSANHLNNLAGAYFTPRGLAAGFQLSVPTDCVVLDLCAGIGALAHAVSNLPTWDAPKKLVCVEKNPEYVEVGRFVVPSATWVCADVFDMEAYRDLGPFDAVISNPPFGRVRGSPKGKKFDEAVVELASTLAPYGAFILPTGRFGEHERRPFGGLSLRPGISVETRDVGWRGVDPQIEIRVYDKEEDDTEAAFMRARALRPAKSHEGASR